MVVRPRVRGEEEGGGRRVGGRGSQDELVRAKVRSDNRFLGAIRRKKVGSVPAWTRHL